jgi:diamine N-acetyltransferase
MSNGPELKAADLIRDGNLDNLSKNQLFISFVAEISEENQTKLVGYTISFFSYSTWQGKSYFLEDLYVKPSYRKLGIGKKLFTENAKFALEEKCSRFDFHVLDWNPAKKFYESLGATNLTSKEGWEFFRLNQSEMESLVGNQH